MAEGYQNKPNSIIIAHGLQYIQIGGSTVTFNEIFTQAPNVVATPGTATGDTYDVVITGRSTTSFSVVMKRNGVSVDGYINWIAVGS